ncbi:MAG: carboxypeptidase-like regulatory domain-containing protein, partial [Lewinella sp.]|nr:carboxypeptidase-like regulatory domain-containing protein [Lewinella sp.]
MKSKQLLLVSTLIVWCNSAWAQTHYSGKIVDAQDNQPLIGALIQVQTAEHGTTTDDHGNFTLSTAQADASIVIQYLGYDEVALALSPEKTNLGVIALHRANTTLDEVIVSASPNNFKGQFKGSNFRINPLTLKKINPLSTEEVLRTVPGVNIVGDMGLSNRPNISIRGSWGRRSKKVLLMEDGTPSAPAPYIAPGAYYNPVSDRLTSIEVYKGADMLRFGPNNM